MKIKWNTARIVLAAVLGSVFWAGCASTPAPRGPAVVENTQDLQTTGPDTKPQERTGNYDFQFQNYDIHSVE